MKVLILLLAWWYAAGLPEARVVRPCYQPPTTGVIVEAFAAPSCPYCVGHRGIEYATRANSPVSAVAPGVATFVGVVVGVRYVTVTQTDGLVATYGMLASTTIRQGDRIASGQIVAATSQSFYFGLRDNGVYVDPAPFFGSITYRARLVPMDKTSPRPPRSRGVVCGSR